MQDLPLLKVVARLVWPGCAWLIATVLMVLVSHDASLTSAQWVTTAAYGGLAWALQSFLATLLLLYRGGHPTSGARESLGVLVPTIVTGTVLVLVFVGLSQERSLSRAVFFAAPPVALTLMLTGNWVYGVWASRRPASQESAAQKGVGTQSLAQPPVGLLSQAPEPTSTSQMRRATKEAAASVILRVPRRGLLSRDDRLGR